MTLWEVPGASLDVILGLSEPFGVLGVLFRRPGDPKHNKNQWFFNIFVLSVSAFQVPIWTPIGPSWTLLARLGVQVLPITGDAGPS